MYIISFNMHLTQHSSKMLIYTRASIVSYMDKCQTIDLSFLSSECFLLSVEQLVLIVNLNNAITESSQYSLSAPQVSSVWMNLFISPSQSGSSALCSHLFVRLQGQLNVARPLRLLLGINLRGARKGQGSV